MLASTCLASEDQGIWTSLRPLKDRFLVGEPVFLVLEVKDPAGRLDYLDLGRGWPTRFSNMELEVVGVTERLSLKWSICDVWFGNNPAFLEVQPRRKASVMVLLDEWHKISEPGSFQVRFWVGIRGRLDKDKIGPLSTEIQVESGSRKDLKRAIEGLCGEVLGHVGSARACFNRRDALIRGISLAESELAEPCLVKIGRTLLPKARAPIHAEALGRTIAGLVETGGLEGVKLLHEIHKAKVGPLGITSGKAFMALRDVRRESKDPAVNEFIDKEYGFSDEDLASGRVIID